MRLLRPCLVVLLSLLSIVSVAGAPRSAQPAPAACLNGTCTLYLPLLKYDLAPVLVTPIIDEQLTTLAPVLTWHPAVSGLHRIQVSTDPGFSLTVTMAVSSTKQVKLPLPDQVDTALTSNLKYATTYFWRVGIVLPAGEVYSPARTFTTPAKDTIQLPGLVPIIAPRNGANLTGNRVLLKWGAIPGAISYRIRMYDATGAQFDPGTVQVAGDQTTFWVEDIPPGTYTWRMKVYTAAGWGPYPKDDYTFKMS